jgi:hypothetical protein
MFHLELGTLPEWFGGISLMLAFAVFARDRGNQTRAQVNRVGIWPADSRLPNYEDNEFVPHIEVVISARNASELPVEVIGVKYVLVVNPPTQERLSRLGGPDGTELFSYAEFVQRQPETGDVPPGETKQFIWWHPVYPSTEGAIEATYTSIVYAHIKDNAGRQWITGLPGTAKPWPRMLSPAWLAHPSARHFQVDDLHSPRRSRLRRTSTPHA